MMWIQLWAYNSVEVGRDFIFYFCMSNNHRAQHTHRERVRINRRKQRGLNGVQIRVIPYWKPGCIHGACCVVFIMTCSVKPAADFLIPFQFWGILSWVWFWPWLDCSRHSCSGCWDSLTVKEDLHQKSWVSAVVLQRTVSEKRCVMF